MCLGFTSLICFESAMRSHFVLITKLLRTPAPFLPVDKTLCAASLLLLNIRPIPGDLHFLCHGDHIIGFQIRGTVAELVITAFNGSGDLILRAMCEVRCFLEVVARPGPTAPVGGAVIRAGAGRAEKLRDDPGN